MRVAVVTAVAVLISAGPAAAAGAGTIDRVIKDRRVAESSGLASSPTHPGVLWTHNDSDNAPVLYAIGPDGGTEAAVEVTGTADQDWEAIAGYRDAKGTAMLAIGDLGDNRARRAQVQIVLLPEPALKDASVRPSRVLRLRYPTGPTDAETLLVDPRAGRMYVLTKGFGGILYAVPRAVWPGPANGSPADSGVLERIAGVPLFLITDGVMLPDGHPLVRTYGDLALLPRITDAVVGGTLQPLAVTRAPAQPQAEGLAVAADGSTLLLSSEGKRQPVLRLPMPAGLADAARRDPATSPESSSASPQTRATSPERPAASPEDPPPAAGSGARPWLVPAAIGAVLAVPAVLLIRRRNGNRHRKRR